MIQNNPFLFQVIFFCLVFSLLLSHCHRWLRVFFKYGHLVMQGMCHTWIFYYCLQGILVFWKFTFVGVTLPLFLLKIYPVLTPSPFYCDCECSRLFWGRSGIYYVIVSLLCSIVRGVYIKYLFLFIGVILFIVWLNKGLLPFIKKTVYHRFEGVNLLLIITWQKVFS